MRTVRLTPDDAVAAFPSIVGYQPHDGDVGFTLLTLTREVRTWGLLHAIAPEATQARAGELTVLAGQLGVGGALLVGYGPHGAASAALLRDELTARTMPVEACAVVGSRWGDLAPGRDRVDQWYALPDKPAWLSNNLSVPDGAAAPGAPKPPGTYPDPPTTPRPPGPGL